MLSPYETLESLGEFSLHEQKVSSNSNKMDNVGI